MVTSRSRLINRGEYKNENISVNRYSQNVTQIEELKRVVKKMPSICRALCLTELSDYPLKVGFYNQSYE